MMRDFLLMVIVRFSVYRTQYSHYDLTGMRIKKCTDRLVFFFFFNKKISYEFYKLRLCMSFFLEESIE